MCVLVCCVWDSLERAWAGECAAGGLLVGVCVGGCVCVYVGGCVCVCGWVCVCVYVGVCVSASFELQ